MTDKLAEICDNTRQQVARRKAVHSLDTLDIMAREREPVRGFEHRLREASQDGFGLIAEIKRASPSKGLIRQDFDPQSHARDYAAGGAACLSVLTDETYFQGHADYLVAAREACSLPVLRKDFMVDPWQVAEARAMGADAILIIVAALDDVQMAEIEAAAIERMLDVLIEVHDEAEMERAARLQSRMLGVNNRDLRSFETDLSVTERLAKQAPAGSLIIGESGIADHADCLRLAKSGVRSFLVGESLMRQDDLETATCRLLNG